MNRHRRKGMYAQQRNKSSSAEEPVKYPILSYRRSKHNHVIVREDKDTKISIGITHAPYCGHHKNVPLNINPDSKDQREAYLLNYPTKDRSQLYTNTKRPLKLDPSDYPAVERIGAKPPQDMSKKKVSTVP